MKYEEEEQKNIFQNTISMYLFKNPLNSYNNFVMNVGRRIYSAILWFRDFLRLVRRRLLMMLFLLLFSTDGV